MAEMLTKSYLRWVFRESFGGLTPRIPFSRVSSPSIFCNAADFVLPRSSTLHLRIHPTWSEDMLRQFLRRRILFAMLMFSMLLGIAFSTPLTNQPASARPCFSLLKEYYDDAFYTNLIGEQYWPCAGQPSSWGSISSYMVSSTEQCGGACDPRNP